MSQDSLGLSHTLPPNSIPPAPTLVPNPGNLYTQPLLPTAQTLVLSLGVPPVPPTPGIPCVHPPLSLGVPPTPGIPCAHPPLSHAPLPTLGFSTNILPAQVPVLTTYVPPIPTPSPFEPTALQKTVALRTVRNTMPCTDEAEIFKEYGQDGNYSKLMENLAVIRGFVESG